MASQYKDSVTWGHNTAQSAEKASRLVDLTKSVAEFERGQSGCGFYVVLATREGQHFSQSTRLEIITNHDADHLDKHRDSDAYQKMQSSVETEELLEKPASTMSFTPKAGFISRNASPVPSLKDQFVWVAKLDSHEGKFEEFLQAIQTHAANVERTEDETLSFLVLQSHDSKNSVTLFERYTNEEYFNNVHSKSESMQEYRKKMESLMSNRVTAGFQIVSGFMDAEGDQSRI